MCTKLHGFTSHNAIIFIVSGARAADLTRNSTEVAVEFNSYFVFSSEMGYPDSLRCLRQSLQVDATIVRQIKQRPLASSSLSIH
jgi:hypothetical protein